MQLERKEVLSEKGPSIATYGYKYNTIHWSLRHLPNTYSTCMNQKCHKMLHAYVIQWPKSPKNVSLSCMWWVYAPLVQTAVIVEIIAPGGTGSHYRQCSIGVGSCMGAVFLYDKLSFSMHHIIEKQTKNIFVNWNENASPSLFSRLCFKGLQSKVEITC